MSVKPFSIANDLAHRPPSPGGEGELNTDLGRDAALRRPPHYPDIAARCPCLSGRTRGSVSLPSHNVFAPIFREMLPVVAIRLPKMLPLKSMTFYDVTDVATFPTSYINYAHPSSIPHPPPSPPFWQPAEGYGSPPGGRMVSRSFCQRRAVLIC